MSDPPDHPERRARPGGTPVRLPRHRFERISKPLLRFMRLEAVSGAVLFMCVTVTLVLANTASGSQLREFWSVNSGLFYGTLEWGRPLRKWINDGLLTLFFFVVALELKRELVTGELQSMRIAALSLAGAIGGMLVPALIYLALQWGEPGVDGWGTVMSTDTAFVVGGLALLGPRVPLSLRAFLLSLVVIDDIGAIIIITIVYSKPLVLPALALGVFAMAGACLLALLGMRNILAYSLIGAVAWLAIDASGIHATITGVLFGLLVPAHASVSTGRMMAIIGTNMSFLLGKRGSDHRTSQTKLQDMESAIHSNVPLTERFENALHPWITFLVMPLFAFANADVELAAASIGDPVTVAVALGLVAGKPLGIVAFSWAATTMGLASRPHDIPWSMIAAGGALAGTGFTMSLLIADLALAAPTLDAARLGVLVGSTVSAIGGIALLAVLLRAQPRVLRRSLDDAS